MSGQVDAVIGEARFTCSVCGAEAGLVRIVQTAARTDVRRESWPGVAIYPLGEMGIAHMRDLLAAGELRPIFEHNFELTPFYCPECEASYCSDHWDWWDVWDDEWTAWRDSVRGRCPRGHERMLED